MNATPHGPQYSTTGKDPSWTQTKTRQGTRQKTDGVIKLLVYADWTRKGTPTLNAKQSLEDVNITTLNVCMWRLFTAIIRHKQHGCEHKIGKTRSARKSGVQ
jgi:hypothetical protein